MRSTKMTFFGLLLWCMLGLTTGAYIKDQDSENPSPFKIVGTCPQKDGEFAVLLPDDNDATVYYMCSNGKPWLKKCPHLTVFDPQKSVCVHAQLQVVPSPYIPVGKCPKKDLETLVLLPDSEDPTIFYMCSNGKPLKKSCPPNTLFDPQIKVCVHDDSKRENETKPNRKCPKQDGDFVIMFPDDEDVTVYYVCSNGKPWKQHCPPLTIFDAEQSVCVQEK